MAQERANSDGELVDFGYRQELRRRLGFGDLLIYGMLFMVPTAPMGAYGLVAQSASGMVPLVYCIGALGMLFTAIAYRGLSRAFPLAGSLYGYVQRAVNPHLGFVAGWLILLDYIMIPSLVYSFVGTWLHGLYPVLPVWLLIAVLLVLVTTLASLGIEVTARANRILFAFQILVFLAFAAAAILYIAGPRGSGFSLAPFWRDGLVDPAFIGAAASIAVISFLGFDGIATLAEEAREPRRDIGRAIFWSLAITALLFILLTWLAQLAAPDSSAVPGYEAETGFFHIAGMVGGSWLFGLTLWSQIIGAGIGNTIPALTSVSRLLYAMGRDRTLPAALARIHPRRGTPWVAILAMAAISAPVALLVPLEHLVRLVNFGAIVSFIILNITSFWHGFVRSRARDARAILLHLAAPIAGILVLGYVWWGFDTVTKLVGAAWLVGGIIWGALASGGYRRVPPALLGGGQGNGG